MLSLMVFVKQLFSLAENKTEHKQTSKVIYGLPGLLSFLKILKKNPPDGQDKTCKHFVIAFKR